MSSFRDLEEKIVSGNPVEVPGELQSWLRRWKRLFINGEWCDGESREVFRTENPATETELSEICLAKKSDVERTVLAARAAFEAGGWSQKPLKERARILSAVGDKILAHRAPLAILESLDTGKPIRETFDGDIPRAAQNFKFFAELAVSEDQPFYPNETEWHFALREPLGTVALITPWNLPLYLESWKIAPALLMGNSVILKPSELTPLTATYFTELLGEMDLPPGVFNLLQGFGENSTGQQLVSHTGVDAISFTGETATGRAIMRDASAGPTRVSFELGGKGSSIIFADADLDRAVDECVRAAFRNQGQICLASPRIFVAREREAEFREKFVAKTRTIEVGDPLSYRTGMGALIGAEHYLKVTSYLKKLEGTAHVIEGGSRPAHLPKGHFLAPTILAGLAGDHPISREEIFGPVVSIYPFDDEKSVIHAVNDTPYGLSASVWTADLARARRVTQQLRIGLVWVNCWFVRELRVPFGGQKRSGVGREGGKHSLEFFSEWKSVCIRS